MSETDIKPIHQSLFPCKDSLAEAREYINSQLPITSPNDMHAALMIFQNTFIRVQELHAKKKATG